MIWRRSLNGQVCVTGGLGFIGSHLCRELAARGYTVTALDRLSGSYAAGAGTEAAAALAEQGVQVVVADVDSPAGARALDSAGAVIHLAALPGVRSRHPEAAFRHANHTLAREALERATHRGGRFVLASTSSIYGNAERLPVTEDAAPSPLNPYAATKLAADRACLAAGARGADAVVARLFTVFGPRQRPDMAFARWIDALLHGRPLDWCAPAGARRELTYVGDAVRALIAVFEHGRAGEAYNVAGCGSTPVRAALSYLEEIVGVRAELTARPPGREAVATAASPHKAARELGYGPRVRVRDGLEAQVQAALEAAGERLEPVAA